MKPIFTRLTRGLLLLPMLALAFTAPLFATGTPASEKLPLEIEPTDAALMGLRIFMDNATVAKQGEVCVLVKANGWQALQGVEFSILYDTTRLTYKTVDQVTGAVPGFVAGIISTPGQGAAPKGVVKVSWYDQNISPTGITAPDGTVLFRLCFTAANIDANTNIRVVYTEILNNNTQPVSPDPNNTPTVVTIGAGGGAAINLDLSDVTVAGPGQEACIKLNAVSGFTAVRSIQLSINYNATQLDFSAVKNFNLAGLTAANFTVPGGANPAGTITMNWTSSTPTTGNTVANNAALVDVCFQGKTGGTTSTVTQNAGAVIKDKDNKDMSFTGTSGVITIQGAPTPTLTLDITDATIAAPGQEVCVKVTAVSGFTNVGSIQTLTMSYNSTQLDFVAVRNITLAGLAQGNFTLPGGSNPAGTIRINSWTSPTASTGTTVANNTALFDLCFTGKSAGIVSAITFPGTPTLRTNTNGNMNFSGTQGQITVQQSGGGGPTGPLTFSLSTGTATGTNQEVCLNLNVVSGFANLVGFGYRINFDNTLLDYVSTKNYNLTGLTANSFGIPIVNGTNSALPVSWDDPTQQGVNVNNNTNIAQVCFRTKTANGTANVTFTNTEGINTSSQTVPLTGNAGSITIGNGQGGGGTTTGVIFDLTDGTATGSNQEVCVNLVAVSGFTGLNGFQYRVNYNADQLTFIDGRNFNLASLTASSIGVPVISGSNGFFTVSWNDETGQGKTVANNTTIAQLCFRTKVANASSNLTFSNTEAIDTGDKSVSVTGQPGTITIGTVTGPADVKLNISSESTQLNQDVCVKVSVADFNAIKSVVGNITFDATALTFKEVRNFGLSGLSVTNFTAPGTGSVLPGNVAMNWSTTDPNGISVANGATIFEVCFTAIKAGSSQVIFGAAGLTVTRSNNQLANVVRGPGTVTVQAVNTGGLTVSIADKNGQQNQETCLDVSVTNFNRVNGFQFEIRYDPAFMIIKPTGGIANLNTTLAGRGLSSGSFNFNNTTGVLVISWIDDQVRGVSLTDNAVLFQVCFNVLGGNGTSQVRFNRQRTNEVYDVDDKTIPVTLKDGSITISNPNAPSIVSPAVITNVPCFGETRGAINIDVRGGSGNYTYRWSNNATTQDLSNLAAGTYGVTVTDTGNNLTASASFNVTQPASAVAISNVVKTDITCFNGTNGAINVTASGGSGTLAYAWNGGLAAVSNPTNVPTGTYTVTVTDANGCRAVSNPTTVTAPTSGVSASVASQNTRCDGSASGGATLSPAGGSGPYTFRWVGGQTTAQINNIGPGSYAYTVTDSRGCTATGNATVIIEPSVRITTTDPVNIDAGNDGAINIAIAGGAAPYTYRWTGPNNYTANVEDISGLSAAGEYCVTVTETGGCIATQCITVTQRLRLGNFVITDACKDQATGSAQVVVTGGAGPYTYRWSANNFTGQTLSTVRGGSYAVTVTDSRNNTVSGNVVIPELNALTLTPNVTPLSAQGGTNGAVIVTPSGGKGPYTFRWGNSATTSTINNLAAGDYCVTVTDQAGCTTNACYKIEVVTAPLAVGATSTDAKCPGENTGAARFQVSGGVAPYRISINSGTEEQVPTGNVLERTNLPGGNIAYKVTDSRGSVIDGTVTVRQPAALSISSLSVRHDTEENGCSGSVALAISGGTPGYSIAWNSTITGFQLVSLCEGDFIPTVVDANGCRKTFDAIKVNTFALRANISNAKCPDDSNGGVDLNIGGGQAPFRIAWLSARGDTVSKTEDLGNVKAGVYRCVVREASGNILEKQFTVGVSSKLQANILVTSNYNGFAVSCATASDGTARMTASGAGEGAPIYEWLQGDRLIIAAQDLNRAPAGKYIARITDGAGCAVSQELELKAPPVIEIDATIDNASCIGGRTGEIFVDAEGGVGGRFTYAWSNQRTTQRNGGLQKGTYTVTVTDRNNCTAVRSFEIKDPQPIQVNLRVINATEGCNGQAMAEVKGGARPYTYRWNAPVTSADSIVRNLCPGEYFIQVVDANGCKSTPEIVMNRILDRRLPCVETRTVISPDGDGSNETFLINCIQEFPGNRISIYNRAGQLVFQTQNYNNDWKGTTQSGEPLPEGPYYYILEYKDRENKDVRVEGSITLLRGE